MRLAEALIETPAQARGAWNFGPDPTGVARVDEVVSKIVTAWGGNAGWDLVERPQVHEAANLQLDSSRARSALGWQPQNDLDAAVQWTTGWYKGFYEGSDARELTLADLERYEISRRP